MPRLIVLNGPPAAGKSTIAQRYVDEHPMALNLEIDAVRRLLGGWRADPHAAGLRARELALGMARDHLLAGHDVVVPQYLSHTDYLARLDAIAEDTDAVMIEFVLLDTKDVLAARFHARTAAAERPEHLDAAHLLEKAGGARQLEAMYDRLLLVVAARPCAKVVPAREGEIDATYATLLAAVE